MPQRADRACTRVRGRSSLKAPPSFGAVSDSPSVQNSGRLWLCTVAECLYGRRCSAASRCHQDKHGD
eukprot:3144643-Pyramimonas_sp.AAC.1